jgi:hypothetical protein
MLSGYKMEAPAGAGRQARMGLPPGSPIRSTVGREAVAPNLALSSYDIAGQLVAFERSAGYGVDWGRRFVFRDHLGSTNVIINATSGLLLWRDRYLPLRQAQSLP